MKVIPIKPGIDNNNNKPDPELVAYFQRMKEAAERGEIQAYLGGFVINDERDDYVFLPDEDYAPALSFEVRQTLYQLESPFE